MESLMSARQVAELLGVHENWVYDQAASGTLPSYKIGGTRRFDPDELRQWILSHREAEREQGALPKKGSLRSRPVATRRAEERHPKLFD
jgi:excisionase family DNA binding protein